MNLDLLPLERLSEIYAISNTPNFLFRKFREIDAVELLSREFSASELLAAANEIAHKSEKNVQDMVNLYACLVALTFKSKDEFRLAIAEGGIPNVRWAPNLIEEGLTLPNPFSESVFTIASAPTSQPIVTPFSTNQSAGDFRIVLPFAHTR